MRLRQQSLMPHVAHQRRLLLRGYRQLACCGIRGLDGFDLVARHALRETQVGHQVDRCIEIGGQRHAVIGVTTQDPVRDEAIGIDNVQPCRRMREVVDQRTHLHGDRRQCQVPFAPARHLEGGAPRTRQAAHRAVEELLRQRGIRYAAVQRLAGRDGDACPRGRHHGQHAVGRKLGEVAHFDALEDVVRQACERKCALGGDHVAQLLPRRLHELVLVLSHHFGAPARREAIARLQREAVEPTAVDHLRVDGVPLGGKFAVDGRCQRRHLVAVLGDISRRHAIGSAVQDARQSGRHGARRVGQHRIEFPRHHRTFEHGLVRRRTVEQKMIAVDERIAQSDVAEFVEKRLVAGELLRRAQAPRQRFDVAHRPGREGPRVIDRQFDVAPLGQRPRDAERGVGHRLAESTLATAFGCRNHAGHIGGFGLEPPRTDQARNIRRWRPLHLGR